jgi:hypothetical protein
MIGHVFRAVGEHHVAVEAVAIPMLGAGELMKIGFGEWSPCEGEALSNTGGGSRVKCVLRQAGVMREGSSPLSAEAFSEGGRMGGDRRGKTCSVRLRIEPGLVCPFP